VGSWWSGRRRDASERLGPKIAYVFDEDVNIYNDERVKWAIAWRCNPEKGTMILIYMIRAVLSGRGDEVIDPRHDECALPLDPATRRQRRPMNLAPAI
jgi:hypothetical protein